jgi:acyl carrier protein
VNAEPDVLKGRLLDVVKRRIADVARIDVSDLDDATLLFPELAPDVGIDVNAPDLTRSPNVSLDSLDILDMLVAFEDAFDIGYDLSALESGEVSPSQLATPERITEFILQTVAPERIEAGLRAELA